MLTEKEVLAALSRVIEPELHKDLVTLNMIKDLKIANVKIEATKGSSLIYVVGTVRNASDHQRFGVRVEFDLFDRAGNKIVTPPSSDYKQIMEPREEWSFRAIVLDPKAASAKLAKIKEDE